ncbi:hypothetical protein PMIN03_000272 [Paraphaeosphaeria minitans]
MEGMPGTNAQLVRARFGRFVSSTQLPIPKLAHRLSAIAAIAAVRNVPAVPTTDAALIHLTAAIRAAQLQTEDAFCTAIECLKDLDLATVMRAATEWIKAHPWETAAIVIPLVLLACTPGFLAAAGFTAGGIAAGSVAAGIQAGIESVGAGSIFAVLTSAGMAGYGVPIVFGGVWALSSIVCWGVAAWKKRGDRPDSPDRAGPVDKPTGCDGDGESEENTKSPPKLLEE